MKQWNFREMALPVDLIKRILTYTYIFGALVHGSMLSKTLLWHDGLCFAYQVTPKDAVALGRWMRAILAKGVSIAFGGTNMGMPLLYGCVSLFFIGISALIIIRLFHIESKLLQIILCGMMVSIPVVASTFFYMYTAPYYFLGLLLSTLAVWVVRDRSGVKGFLLGALCIGCMLGIYQAYFSVAVSLFVILLILDIVNDRFETFPSFLKRGFYCLGICIAGFILYFIVWKAFMRVMGIAAADYQGISSFGKLSIGVYLNGFRTAYTRFFLTFIRTGDNLYPMGLKMVQAAIVALSIAYSVVIVAVRLRKNVLQGMALAVLIALLPLCFNLVYLIGAGEIHMVMLYGQCMLYVYLLCIMRHARQQNIKLSVPCYRLTAAVLLLMIAMNAYFVNGSYMKAEMELQQTVNNMTVLVARIKALDDYRDDMPVCIVIKGEKDATVTFNDVLSGYSIVPMGHLFPHDKAGALRNIKAVLERWCGFSPEYISYGKFKHEDIIEEMPDYPDAGSVRIVDDTVVVRM